jgi:hypothetical protein
MTELSYSEMLSLAASVVALLISLLAYRRSGPAAALAAQQLEDLASDRDARLTPVLSWGLHGDDTGSGYLSISNRGDAAVHDLVIDSDGTGPVPKHALQATSPLALRPGQAIKFPASRTLDGAREVFKATVTYRGPESREYVDQIEVYWS